MMENVVILNSVPTTVRTWGKKLGECTATEDIVLVITGNPGLTGYYHHFVHRIHEKLGYTCILLGHAGHEEPKGKIVPNLKKNEGLYDLDGQVQHKVDFFTKNIPEGAKVHLIGHSIGSYMILKLLKMPEVNSKILNSYLLFPTIENMAKSPNGKFFTNYMTFIHRILVLLSYVFVALPKIVQKGLIYAFSKIFNHDIRMVDTTVHLVRPSILSKIFYLAFDEMDNVLDLDLETLKNNKDRIKLYYAVSDGWVCNHFYTSLISNHPDIKVEVCSKAMQHAFVLEHSEKAGEMVADWILDTSQNLTQLILKVN